MWSKVVLGISVTLSVPLQSTYYFSVCYLVSRYGCETKHEPTKLSTYTHVNIFGLMQPTNWYIDVVKFVCLQCFLDSELGPVALSISSIWVRRTFGIFSKHAAYHGWVSISRFPLQGRHLSFLPLCRLLTFPDCWSRQLWWSLLSRLSIIQKLKTEFAESEKIIYLSYSLQNLESCKY